MGGVGGCLLQCAPSVAGTQAASNRRQAGSAQNWAAAGWKEAVDPSAPDCSLPALPARLPTGLLCRCPLTATTPHWWSGSASLVSEWGGGQAVSGGRAGMQVARQAQTDRQTNVQAGRVLRCTTTPAARSATPLTGSPPTSILALCCPACLPACLQLGLPPRWTGGST